MKKVILVCLACFLLFSSGCSGIGEKRYEAQFITLFDTVTQIIGYGKSKEEFTRLSQKIYDSLYEYHCLYDIYNLYDGINNIKTINDNAGGQAVTADKKIIDLLLFAKSEYEKTGGACNIALGSVLTIWHQYRQKGIDDPANAALPPEKTLAAASLHTDIKDVFIDPVSFAVSLADPLMSLDVGAVAKGYAVEQTALLLEAEGYDNLLISVGGNVRAIGGKYSEKGNPVPWKIGIKNPDRNSDDYHLLYVFIDGLSVVTSGNYERYYTVDGKVYHHIIDPETLYPSDYYAAVTVLCRDSGVADLLSTALFNMPPQTAKAYLRARGDAEALFVLPDGTVEYSDHFKDYLRE